MINICKSTATCKDKKSPAIQVHSKDPGSCHILGVEPGLMELIDPNDITKGVSLIYRGGEPTIRDRNSKYLLRSTKINFYCDYSSDTAPEFIKEEIEGDDLVYLFQWKTRAACVDGFHPIGRRKRSVIPGLGVGGLLLIM